MNMKLLYQNKKPMSDSLRSAVEELQHTQDTSDENLLALITYEENAMPLHEAANAVRQLRYGQDVYIRGLIEYSNHCANNCYYCGIRRDNHLISRYRLSKSDLLHCAQTGYELGFRTFVIQGGEDAYFTDEILVDHIASIHDKFPDCAITLSLGERSKESYLKLYQAGATRYLLRHETADCNHYQLLHPSEMSFDHRMQCLYDLEEIGYQVGAGMMIGSPYQTPLHLLSDIRFLQKFSPDMVGIGPYLNHAQTPFYHMPNGSMLQTLRMLSILRLILPHILLPATTALGTIDPNGREYGLLCGANVVMPNLSPVGVRDLYSLYENKICTGEESAQCLACLKKRVESCGYRIVTDRGDVKRIE